MGDGSGDSMAILLSIILILMLTGYIVPKIDAAFNPSNTNTELYGGVYNSVINNSQIDCNKWYAAQFIEKIGNPVVSSGAYVANYGLNWSTNNTGMFGQFQNFFAAIYNMGANLFGDPADPYTPVNYTFNALTDAEAANLGLPPCPTSNPINYKDVGYTIGQMLKMVVWSCDGIPDWLNLTFFMVLRLIALLIIIKDFIIPLIPDWL